MTENKLQVKLIKSLNGRPIKHKLCVNGLGIKKINQTVILNNTNEIQGMIKKVSYLLNVTGL